MALPHLRLTDDNGNTYNFNNNFAITNDSWDLNISVNKLLYSPGGIQMADETLNPRIISIKGYIEAETYQDFEVIKNELESALIKGGKLAIFNDYTQKEIDVRGPKVSGKWVIYGLIREYQIDFACDWPFWEDVNETTSTNVMTGNGSFVIDLTGTPYLVYPVIEIHSDQSVDVPSIKMYNLNDGGLAFNYNDPMFYAGNVVVIDSKLGTVTLNDTDSIHHFAPPVFLRLQPSENTLYYEGAACTIKVKYKKVYL